MILYNRIKETCFLSFAIIMGLLPVKLEGQTFMEISKELKKYDVVTSMKEASKNPTNVYRLNLSNRKIDEAELKNLLPRLKNLRELVLNDTFISQLPSTIGENRQLNFLQIQHLENHNNNLQSLPASITLLENMVFINLIGNPNLQWPVVFEKFSKLPRLSNIALMNNNLKTLPKQILKNKNIQMIWLGKNPDLRLRNTFNKLSKLPILQQLGLGNSNHKVLSSNVAKLKSIENMWLSGNNWTKLKGINRLINLKQMSLDDCNLQKMPKELISNNSLHYLSLAKNPHLNFDEVLAQLPKNLRILNLNSNEIKDISPNSLSNLKLERLLIRKNPLSPRLTSQLDTLNGITVN